MFGLDPFSRPVAIVEILLLLSLAAFIGWLLGRLVRSGRVSSLRSAITDKQKELDECRRSQSGGNSAIAAVTTLPVDIQPEPVIEPAQFFVSADPLLPAYSHDDTPTPVIVELLPSEEETLLPIASTLEFPPIEEAALVATSTPAVDTIEPASSDERETVVLNRIAARASELNFDRIGLAVASEADDLKDIVGVGPFLERKLHSLGIYTFRQIANFSKEDVQKVNEIIEFFPGRIERDNWVGQAKTFHQRKHGRS